MRKTRLMMRVEAKIGMPLEKFLPAKLTEDGLSRTAEELEVSKATLGYWLLKLGINVRRVAVAPGETLLIGRGGALKEVALDEIGAAGS